MLCELEVNNIGTYVELITRIDAEQQYRMWFRGQSDYSWGLVPSVQRKDGIKADDVMVAFDFILVFVFLVLAVQLLAGRIKRIGFTVQTVQIKLIPHDTISVLVKDRSLPKLVMLENQILQCSTIVGTLGYQGSTVLDEPEREAGTTSIPIPQREESENIPLPDLPGQLENVQQSGNEIAERGMPT